MYPSCVPASRLIACGALAVVGLAEAAKVVVLVAVWAVRAMTVDVIDLHSVFRAARLGAPWVQLEEACSRACPFAVVAAGAR